MSTIQGSGFTLGGQCRDRMFGINLRSKDLRWNTTMRRSIDQDPTEGPKVVEQFTLNSAMALMPCKLSGNIRRLYNPIKDLIRFKSHHILAILLDPNYMIHKQNQATQNTEKAKLVFNMVGLQYGCMLNYQQLADPKIETYHIKGYLCHLNPMTERG